MKMPEALAVAAPGAEIWPLSVEAYHALGEAGLMPKRTELLYGFITENFVHGPAGQLASAVFPSFKVELSGLFASE